MESASIAIRFDKSHLITIGERLYGESLELLRELVANAYDADAENVWIEVTPDRLTVRDDGWGMDEEGLREFFVIGSQNKRFVSVSPAFRRQRIGQFGIGKFAVLAACDRFRVRTQRCDFAAEAVFDQREWEGNDVWAVPLQRLPIDESTPDGTTVTLERLKRTFALPDIERFIRERFPLSAPHFAIVLNGKQLEPTIVGGKKFPVDVPTPHGRIRGELILPHVTSAKGNAGIECIVRGVVICRSTFGLEAPIMAKLRGRVAADFLPITSDRSRFITDTVEYRAFVLAMQREIARIARTMKEFAEQKEQRKADLALKDTLTRMRRAIRRNPDIAPPVMSATGEIDEGSSVANAEKMAPEATAGESSTIEAMQMTLRGKAITGLPEEPLPDSIKEPPPKKIRVKNLKGKTAVARAIKIGDIGITCCLENCGRDRPAAFTDAGIIFINTDHPLYRRQQERGQDLLGFYLTYLLSQQVSLMLSSGDVRRAFQMQERLLTDSW